MITIDPSIRLLTPNIRMGIVTCKVNVGPTTTKLWDEISAFIEKLRETETIADIQSVETIQETRRAYKLYGKEPSRYRPSAEALRRRILQGKNLYQVNNLVEIINWCSLESGFSIGGYDAQLIRGAINLRLGKEGEAYSAIARGNLNIQYLPVLNDELSSFGSPTSDSERTKITNSTTQIMLVYFDFSKNSSLSKSLEDIESRLKKYAHASDFRILMEN
jgi:DNA/RNA-binding domain of Phe-tRNA-synthetase-like protein